MIARVSWPQRQPDLFLSPAPGAACLDDIVCHPRFHLPTFYSLNVGPNCPRSRMNIFGTTVSSVWLLGPEVSLQNRKSVMGTSVGWRRHSSFAGLRLGQFMQSAAGPRGRVCPHLCAAVRGGWRPPPGAGWVTGLQRSRGQWIQK